MHTTIFIALGALLAALAVGLGALGAHALKTHLSATELETFQTAVHYQMIHAIGLILLGLLNGWHRSRWFDASGVAMLIGIVLFCGFLYAWVATGKKALVFPVPFGGVTFIIAWLMAAIGAIWGKGT
jgi:uncharacterized membrane protein YgdD (TMEM256/DUF423 family)